MYLLVQINLIIAFDSCEILFSLIEFFLSKIMTHPSAVVAAVAAVMLFVICNFSLHKIEEGEIYLYLNGFFFYLFIK